jgi:hypothetical protein
MSRPYTIVYGVIRYKTVPRLQLSTSFVPTPSIMLVISVTIVFVSM